MKTDKFSNMGKPKSVISVEDARKMQQNWVKSRGSVLQKERGEADGHDFVFSVAELQEFLDYIKAKTSSDNPGVRIYLGAYGPKITDQATLFLSATKGDSSDDEDDYDIEPLNRVLNGIPPRIY